MQSFFVRILDNALLVAVLLAVAGVGLASIGLTDPAVACFLGCGILLIFKSSRSPALAAGTTAAEGRPTASQA